MHYGNFPEKIFIIERISKAIGKRTILVKKKKIFTFTRLNLHYELNIYPVN